MYLSHVLMAKRLMPNALDDEEMLGRTCHNHHNQRGRVFGVALASFYLDDSAQRQCTLEINMGMTDAVHEEPADKQHHKNLPQ
jgi:hypothetical protein